MRAWVGIVVWMAAACYALAQDRPAPADLPATSLARQWLDQDASVREARSALEAANHGAGMLRAGTYEWTARVAVQRRNFKSGGGDSKEWNAQLERGIRINGKAELDRQIGDAEVSIAQARVSQAVHEAARSLLDAWIDGGAAVQAEKLYRDQKSFAQANLRAVESRKKAGDASALDLAVATSDTAEVERQASQARTNLEKARARLRVRFPDAKLPEQPFSNPVPPEGTELQWMAWALQASGPIRAAESQLRRAELSAMRAAADRIPDPTVGVFAASEAHRNERIVGISVSIPLGGSYRRERAQQAMQEAEAARAALERLRRELESAVAETFADATGSFARWRLAEQGAAAAGENARLTQRAYSLGEADLQALLLARRQFLEASRSALEARAETLRANYRLQIDAHRIWGLQDDTP